MLTEFTASSIQTFLDCRQKFKFSYIDLIAPRLKPWTLTDGSAFHLGMEMINSKETGQTVVAEIKRLYDMLEDEVESAEDTEEVIYHREFMTGMIIGHLLGVKRDYEEILPEQTKRFDLGPYKIAMKVDGIVTKNGQKWLKEYKTTAWADIEGYLQKVEMDMQVDMYTFGVGLEIPDLQGVLYEVARKPLLKRKKDEEFKDFCTRVKQDYIKRPEFYFHHKYVYRSPMDIKYFKKELILTILDMVEAMKSERYYRNRSNCKKYGECTFKRLCFHSDPRVIEGLMTEYYRKKECPHEELEVGLAKEEEA